MVSKAKIRTYLEEDTLKVKVMISQIMLSKESAKSSDREQDYITHIIIYVGKRVLFNFKPSSYISDNPLFKIIVKLKEIKEGDLIEVKWTTLLGYKGHYSKKIKNYVKP
jgi:hypothetical protein